MRLLELFYLLFYEDPHKSGQECYEIKVNIVTEYLPTYENRPIASVVRHGKLASCNESDSFDSLLQKVELVSTLRN